MQYAILHIEDSKTDADLVKRIIQKSGLDFSYCLASDKDEVVDALHIFEPNVILCDHSLPSFNSKMAYVICKEKNPNLPFILVTGSVSEEFAVDMLKTGVDDYLLKTNLKRLPIAIQNAVSKRHNDQKVQVFRNELHKSETHLRTIFENSSNALLLLNTDFQIIEFNSLMSKFTELTLGHSYQKNENMLEVLPAARGEKLRHNFAKVLRGEIVSYESVYKVDDLRTIYFLVNMNPVRDTAGEIDGLCISITDITDQKRATQVVIESEKKYKSLIENLPEAVYTCDENGYVQLYNQAAVKLWGKEPVVGKDRWYGSWEAFNIDGEDLTLENCPMHLCLTGEKVVHGREVRVLCTDGTYKHILPYPTPLFNAEGKLTGAVNMLLDITDKKEKEILIRKSEEKYRTLIDQAADAIFINDLQGNILEANDSGSDMLGYTKEELVKMTAADLYSEQELLSKPLMFAELIAGERTHLERKILHSNGSEIPVEITAKMLSDGRIMAIIRNITDRKKAQVAIAESENRLRTIVEAEPECVKLLDREGLLEDMNAAGLAMIEADSLKQVKGKAVLGVIAEPYKKAFESLIHNVFKGIPGTLQFEILGLKGTHRWLESHAVPLKNVDGKIMSLLSVTRDITASKKAEVALRESEIFNRSILSSIDDHIAVLEANGDIISVNTAWDKFSIDNGETVLERSGVGSNYISVCERSAKAGEATAAKALLGFQQVVKKEIPFFELEYTCHSAVEQRWFLMRIVNFADDSQKVVMMHIDISDMKLAAEETKSLTNRLLLATNSAGMGIWDWNITTNHLLWDEGMYRLYNIDGNLFGSVYSEWFSRLHPEDSNMVNEQLQLAISGKKQYDIEFRIIRDDQSIRHIKATALTERDSRGKAVRMIGVNMDITERKQNEKEIRDYKFALDVSSLVDISDSNGIIRHVNKNFCKLSKFSAKELIGQDHRILNAGFHSKELFKNLWETVGDGKIWSNEVKNKAKDGSFFWSDTTIVPFLDSHGKPFQFITIRKDITKRKNAETQMAEAVERYDILADATSDTIWDWDIVNNTMLYNEGITNMFGYKTAEIENMVDWWSDKLHSEDFQKVTDTLYDVFKTKNERMQLSYRFRCADGSYKYIFDRAFVIFDTHGKAIRMIGAMQDVTYQSEEEIRVAKAIIDAQEAERQHLGAELHDNINQILAGTVLALGMAKSTRVEPAEQVDFINTAIGYINQAIDETRKLSHTLAPASFDDSSLKDLFETLLFNINLDERFTTKLHFDDPKKSIPENTQINLYRILQEQTKNIIKYAEASLIEISLTFIDHAVRLRIYDNGKGFDTKAKKTGIGLSNIKKRAEALSGKYILHTAPGNGCEMIIEIPLSGDE